MISIVRKKVNKVDLALTELIDRWAGLEQNRIECIPPLLVIHANLYGLSDLLYSRDLEITHTVSVHQ